MSNKFTYEGYTITVTFKDDFNLSMTASLVMTGEHFMNEAIELGKIKKDTVLATLSRKSEKNLRCIYDLIKVSSTWWTLSRGSLSYLSS